MWLSSKLLTQVKLPPFLLRPPVLLILTLFIVAVLAYIFWPAFTHNPAVTSISLPQVTDTVPAAAVASEEDTTEAALESTAPEPGAPASIVFYLSLAQNSAQTVGSVSEVRDEDILSFDGTDFALVFDGSAAGLPANADLDAFHFLDAETILISVDKPVTIGPLKIDDSDIVKFEATSLGPDTTAGTFSPFLVGEAVDLTTGGENVDGLTVLSDGTLLISTEGRAKVAGENRNIRVEKEDILAFTPTQPDDYSRGVWSLYFDGANVGIRGNNENIDGLASDPDGQIYFTTTGRLKVNDLDGSGEDVFSYMPVSSETSLTSDFSPARFFEGSKHGLKRNDIDAISFP